jgi:hypothetical protein
MKRALAVTLLAVIIITFAALEHSTRPEASIRPPVSWVPIVRRGVDLRPFGPGGNAVCVPRLLAVRDHHRAGC